MAAAEGDPPIPALENHVAGDESSLVVVRVRRAGLLRELPRCHRLGLSTLPLSGSSLRARRRAGSGVPSL